MAHGQDAHSARQEAAGLAAAVAEADADRSELSCSLAEAQVCPGAVAESPGQRRDAQCMQICSLPI